MATAAASSKAASDSSYRPSSVQDAAADEWGHGHCGIFALSGLREQFGLLRLVLRERDPRGRFVRRGACTRITMLGQRHTKCGAVARFVHFPGPYQDAGECRRDIRIIRFDQRRRAE